MMHNLLNCIGVVELSTRSEAAPRTFKPPPIVVRYSAKSSARTNISGAHELHPAGPSHVVSHVKLLL